MPQTKTAVVYFSVSGRTQTAAEAVGRYLQLTPVRLKLGIRTLRQASSSWSRGPMLRMSSVSYLILTPSM